MKEALAFYWLLGCILVGLADGHHAARCPHDPHFSSVEAMATVAIWPAGIAYAIEDSSPLTCKVQS
jgi:hypothetical protein